VQREVRSVLVAVMRAQRRFARCLARRDETKATEEEVCKIRHQSILVERMIEAFNAAKSDAELSAAMQLGRKADGCRRRAKHMIAKDRKRGFDSISASNHGVVEVFSFEKGAPSERPRRIA